ncbi:uncharacterized protein [Lepeophtheirus salmonis]|uniref:Parafibrominlike [Acyrthosiphon pisum] n=1 Tax=Lepeophtheirus salmonis TaxID=72036 RepID=A0A0K2SYA4_LEPSM|nr:uncharacterized protein LOC121127436 isoform X2 [Lepeophtheirus salmonis]
MNSKRKDHVVVCEGVIFQFNSEVILFEFRNEGEEAIGMLSTSSLILRNGERIPRGALEKNTVSKYIEIGDAIDCRAFRNMDMNKFVYVEEEKGEEKVKIRPDWCADKAFVISSSSRFKKVDSEGDSLTLAPDAEDMDIMFGDNDINKVDDLRAVLQCRKIEKSKNNRSSNEEYFKTPSSLSTRRSREEITPKDTDRNLSSRRSIKSEDRSRSSTSTRNDRVKKRYESKDEYSKDRSCSINSSNSKTNMNRDMRNERKSSTPIFRAELVGIKKPGRNKDIVIGGIMEIIDDSRYCGKKAVFSNNSLYVFGHPLGRADLSYYLKKGDEFNVEINDMEGSLTIKRGWYNGGNFCSFEEEMSLPARVPSKCYDFRSWLKDREISFDDFTDWILGKTKVKPYFPFPSPCFTGIIEYIVKEESLFGDGGIVRITSEGAYRDKYVVFEKSDFYIGGVNVGHADLRILLRPKDRVYVQILEMSTADKKRYKYMTKDKDIPLCGQLCFVGSIIPKDTYALPAESEELITYLNNIGLSIQEFTLMKNQGDESSKVEKEAKKPDVQKVESQSESINGPLALIKNLTAHLSMEDNNKVMFALSLTIRALNISSITDTKANDLLQTAEDISNAVWLSKIFTHVLINKMQTKMRQKILNKFGSLIGSTFKEQEKQIASYELINGPQETMKNYSTNNSSPIVVDYENGVKKSENIVELMKKVEKEIENTSKKPQSGFINSSKAPKRDMKKILESYATSTVPPKVDSLEMNKLSPLKLLYLYIERNKTIALRNNMLYFGDIGLPLGTKTNFSMFQSRSNAPKKYYTVYDLYFFWKNRKMEHSMYKRTADREKCNYVSSDDRRVVLDYFSGRCLKPSNLVDIPEEELNSSLFNPPAGNDMDHSQTPPAKKLKLNPSLPFISHPSSSNYNTPIISTSTGAVVPNITTSGKLLSPKEIKTSAPSVWKTGQSDVSPFSSLFQSTNPEPSYGQQRQSFSFSAPSMSSLPDMGSGASFGSSMSFSGSDLQYQDKFSPKSKVVGFSSSFSFGNSDPSGTGFSSAFDSNPNKTNLINNNRKNTMDFRNQS